MLKKTIDHRLFYRAMHLAAASGLAMASSQALAQSSVAHRSTASSKPAGSDTTAKSAPIDNDIIVTANKSFAQKVLDAPLAIQAISGQSLQKTGATGFLDIATKIPGLSVEDLGPGDRKYVIRGVDSTGESTVGVYYDEAVISGANSNDGGGLQADIKLFDLDHVEVLRGPQGTLYGASSMSGTIRFITKKPDLHNFGGYMTAEVSGTSHGSTNYDGNTALNLPIVDGKLGLRVVGWYLNDSGFINQIRLGTVGLVKGVNNDHTVGGRAMLRYQPIDDLTIDASVTSQVETSQGSSRYTPTGTTSFSGPGLPAVAGCDLCNTDVTASPSDDHSQIYSLTANYKAPIGLFTATVNQFNRTIAYNFDSTPINFAFGVPYQAQTVEPRKQDTNAIEVRYASLFDFPVNIVIGGSRESQINNLTVQVVRTNGLGQINAPFSILASDDCNLNPGSGNTCFGRIDNRQTTQYAGFGEVTWKPTSKLTVLGGVRYFTERLNGYSLSTHPFAGGYLPGQTPPLVPIESQTFNKITPKANVSYDFSRAFLLYATVSEGFRGGGINPQSDPFSVIPGGYQPDSLWNYESGAKGRIFGGHLQYQVDAYLINWSNIQVQQTTPDGAFVYIGNAGGARVKGFEFEFTGTPIKHLDVNFSGSYQDAYLTKGATPEQKILNPTLGLTGESIPNVAKFQFNVGANYTIPISHKATINLAVDDSYRGAINAYFASNPFNVPLKAYHLVNMRVSLTSGPWTATAFMRNVTNNRAQISAINSQQDPDALLTVRPRTTGLSVTRNF